MYQTETEPLLSFDDLWTQYQKTKNRDIRNAVALRYGYIVKCIAVKTIGYYQHINYMEDVINEGLIALLEAFDKYDKGKNVKFETYASIKVRGAIIDYIRKQDCFPRRLKHIARSIGEAEERLGNQLGREPTGQEVADYLHVSLDEYEKMQSETCALNMLSFEEMVYEKGMEALPIGEGKSSIEGPEQVMAHKEMQNVLAKCIETLNEREQLVISLYYKEHLKIKEISDVLGIGSSRVSQIHSSALHKLKDRMIGYYNL